MTVYLEKHCPNCGDQLTAVPHCKSPKEWKERNEKKVYCGRICKAEFQAGERMRLACAMESFLSSTPTSLICTGD